MSKYIVVAAGQAINTKANCHSNLSPSNLVDVDTTIPLPQPTFASTGAKQPYRIFLLLKLPCPRTAAIHHLPSPTPPPKPPCVERRMGARRWIDGVD